MECRMMLSRLRALRAIDGNGYQLERFAENDGTLVALHRHPDTTVERDTWCEGAGYSLKQRRCSTMCRVPIGMQITEIKTYVGAEVGPAEWRQTTVPENGPLDFGRDILCSVARV